MYLLRNSNFNFSYVLGCERTGSDNASDKIVAFRNNARMKL